MNQFDNEVSSTLKEIAERVETPPYLKDRIDKELLRRCPEYRKKIAVIFGGCSPEYSVSLQSAYAVISHMDTEVYTPVLIGISQSGDWFLYEEILKKLFRIHGVAGRIVRRLWYHRTALRIIFCFWKTAK